MNYETIPTPVEAYRQQLVMAKVPFTDGDWGNANPGDWIVRWPNGNLDVFKDSDFKEKFRKPPITFDSNKSGYIRIGDPPMSHYPPIFTIDPPKQGDRPIVTCRNENP